MLLLLFFLTSFQSRSSPLFSRPCPWNGFAAHGFISATATASDWVTPLSSILRRVCSRVSIFTRSKNNPPPPCQNSKRSARSRSAKRSTDLSLLSIRIYLESLDSWRLSVKLPRRFSPVDENSEMQRGNLSLSCFCSSLQIEFHTEIGNFTVVKRTCSAFFFLLLSFPRNNYSRKLGLLGIIVVDMEILSLYWIE